MKLQDVRSAKRYKVKMLVLDSIPNLRVDTLIEIKGTQKQNEFFLSQYGKNVSLLQGGEYLYKTDTTTSEYIAGVLDNQSRGNGRYIFQVEAIEKEYIILQTYEFSNIIEFKTPIIIQLTEELLEKTDSEKLSQYYTWDDLEMPAIFSANYKRKEKQQTQIRFISKRNYLIADNTAAGIIAKKMSVIKQRFETPIDLYLAPEIAFVAESEELSKNGELFEHLRQLSEAGSYFDRWDAYNVLSEKAIDEEQELFGDVPYSDYEVKMEHDRLIYAFNTDGEADARFKGREIGVLEESFAGEQDIKLTEKLINVGEIERVEQGKLITAFSDLDSNVKVPSSGILRLYTAGNKVILKRRNAARRRLANNDAPIKGLAALIETGVSAYKRREDWGSNQAITSAFRKNFGEKADLLNSAQADAVELAINTPDIALIQGPPGTGKTTVIKAICERFREIFEKAEKDHQKIDPEYKVQSPKILISSFQNEAVDNAISAPLPGDIPAYRKTAKRTNESTKRQNRDSLDRWYNELVDKLQSQMVNDFATKYVNERKQLNDEFFAYKHSGESIEKAAELLKHYLSYVDIQYPTELIDKARKIIKLAVPSEAIVDETDPIVTRLKAQRLSIEAFADDGQLQARRLKSQMSWRDDISDKDKTIVSTIAESDEPDTKDFEAYIDTVKRLKEIYCSEEEPKYDTEMINQCILDFSKFFSQRYIDSLSDTDGKKSLIISEFLDNLGDEYENLVKKYSMTTAATCQTSIDMHTSNQTYDLVIVDEAARANPLDLMIPMSMGKKIILVGDQKQLPHMLEPDVLRLILDDPRYKDLPELEKSLFERLFDMFCEGDRPKAISLTEQFRMHPDICDFVSKSFYDGKLATSASVDKYSKSSPKEINEGNALTFVNVPFSRGPETKGASKSRVAEAEAIARDAKYILDVNNGNETRIGIITFYAAQVKRLETHLKMILNDDEYSRIEVGTVDAFQGKEFDYVMLSCVRSNLAKDGAHVVGFLEKPNRLCVAFSRAIRQLIVYGDLDTLEQIPCFMELKNRCNAGGGYYREY